MDYNKFSSKCFADHENRCSALKEKMCENCGYQSCKFYKTKEQMVKEVEYFIYKKE